MIYHIEIPVPSTLYSNKVSGEDALFCSLTGAFAANIYKVWMYKKTLTINQDLYNPNGYVGMGFLIGFCISVINIAICMGENFQDYSLIQDLRLTFDRKC